ncbi:hypothetical protein H2O64_00915 [Kordia sp. YSTF-M3]|uniref:Natural product n=1 Tax=Kordia aestuariivivens TaxID=2759037 RepID=A0ABR7Q3S4_9FLAO|nr:hypothetical protein [Kordia aestuariivivens]MBC8753209.1 hypothetical protein [Kordia aestuariivivens]
MKKKNLINLKLNKKSVSNLSQNSVVGGTNWPPRENQSESCFGGCGITEGQTGSWCLTGNQTNCQ